MKYFDNIIIGILIGLLLPVGFLWLYFLNFNPEMSFIESLTIVWGNLLFARLMLLAAVPNLAILFFVKQQDAFKLGKGILIGMTPYFIASLISLIIF